MSAIRDKLVDVLSHEVAVLDPFDSEALAEVILQEIPEIRVVHKVVASLKRLIASLEWEENRSGTTYAGYENARSVLRRLKEGEGR